MRLNLRTAKNDIPRRSSCMRHGLRGVSILLLSACSLVLTSCGPSLQPTMEVPTVKVSGAKITKDTSTTNTYLFVDEFTDGRTNKVFVKNNKKEIAATGDMAPKVADALKQALQQKGFSFSESAPVIVAGEVREWNADVSGHLPTKVDAHAAVFVEILDPANKRIYSGVYKGYASIEAASVAVDDVKKTLANAMEEAVTQVTADKQLVSVLASY